MRQCALLPVRDASLPSGDLLDFGSIDGCRPLLELRCWNLAGQYRLVQLQRLRIRPIFSCRFVCLLGLPNGHFLPEQRDRVLELRCRQLPDVDRRIELSGMYCRNISGHDGRF